MQPTITNLLNSTKTHAPSRKPDLKKPREGSDFSQALVTPSKNGKGKGKAQGMMIDIGDEKEKVLDAKMITPPASPLDDVVVKNKIQFARSERLRNLLEREEGQLPVNPDYLNCVQVHKEAEEWRSKLVLWMFTRNHHLITRDTSHIALRLFDAYLSLAPVLSYGEYCAAAIGCLFLALKLTCDFICSRDEYIQRTHLKKISPSHLDRFESQIATALHHNLYFDSPLAFYPHLQASFFHHPVFAPTSLGVGNDEMDEIWSNCFGMMEVLVQGKEWMGWKTSEVTAVCFAMSVQQCVGIEVPRTAMAGLIACDVKRYKQIIKEVTAALDRLGA
ncbi:hypothetical protein YB2330_004177 [Saitoella coloradoensis]